MTTVQGSNTVSPELLAAVNGTRKTAATAAEETQNRFLTLLVTQMRNQDPLNPMDNAQVTSQMAQLSTVTGIDKLNVTLQALQGSYQSSQTLQAASMIGHGVLAPGSGVQLTGGRAILGVELASPADSVEVKIRNAAGVVVHTMNLGGKDAGTIPLAWDGRTDSGAAAPDGAYRFEVTAKRDGKAVTSTALAFGEVTSVSTGAQGVKLNVSDGGSINLADVRQIL